MNMQNSFAPASALDHCCFRRLSLSSCYSEQRKFGRLDVFVSIINDDEQRALMPPLPVKSAVDRSVTWANTQTRGASPGRTPRSRSVKRAACLTVGN